MKKEYIAHINEYTNAIQTVQQHSSHTAVLCREYAIPVFKDFLYVVGLLHDIGKYMDEFQKRIQGDQIRVEHSTCGARIVSECDGVDDAVLHCRASFRAAGCGLSQ